MEKLIKFNIQRFADEPVNKEVTEPKKSEVEMIPQSQVNGIVAKEVKSAIEKLLKDDLGVEDVKSAKDGLAKFKEMQESQKTEAQRTIEENAKLKEDLSKALSEVRTIKTEKTIASILKEMEIEDKYASTVLKLANLSGIEEITQEKLKPVIEKVIEEELPMLLNDGKVKIGVDKPEDKKPTSGAKDYLDKKYGDPKSPYYSPYYQK